MTTRRYLVLQLPLLATDRLRHVEPDLQGHLLACWATLGNRRLLTAVDAPGTALHPGQALADAQAMHPELVLRQPRAPLARRFGQVLLDALDAITGEQPRSLVPDGPPARVRLDGTVHAVLRADGPDRIEPEWWCEPEERPGRDYYRVELASGARLWIGRAGPLTADAPARWFLHGYLA